MYILIDDYPKHEHVGTTIFQNKEGNAASNTHFADQYYDRIVQLLSVKDYKLIRLTPNETLSEQRIDLFSYTSGSIHFTADIKSVFNEAAGDNDLDFVIVVYPIEGPAWPNSSAYVDGYGLYTHCRYDECTAAALDHVSARIYDVKHNSSLKPMDFRLYQRPALEWVSPADGVDAFSTEDIDRAAATALDKFMSQFTVMMTQSDFIP
ncbi:MAG: hypothetical protein AAGI44_17975 [Pseudomonadota bacterium]